MDIPTHPIPTDTALARYDVWRMTSTRGGSHMSASTDLMPLSRARDYIPGRPHLATITRWRLDGILAPDGERVRLRATRVGGRHMTSQADIAAFLGRLNADPAADDPETEADIARRNRETRQALAALGVGSAVDR